MWESFLEDKWHLMKNLCEQSCAGRHQANAGQRWSGVGQLLHGLLNGSTSDMKRSSWQYDHIMQWGGRNWSIDRHRQALGVTTQKHRYRNHTDCHMLFIGTKSHISLICLPSDDRLVLVATSNIFISGTKTTGYFGLYSMSNTSLKNKQKHMWYQRNNLWLHR